MVFKTIDVPIFYLPFHRVHSPLTSFEALQQCFSNFHRLRRTLNVEAYLQQISSYIQIGSHILHKISVIKWMVFKTTDVPKFYPPFYKVDKL